MKSSGKPLYRVLIEPQQFERYLTKGILQKINWNQEFRRKPADCVFQGKKILIPVRPLKSDRLKIRGIRVDRDLKHKDNVLSIKIKNNNNAIENYAPYLAVLNSSFCGYYLYQISSQWGKGGEKRSALRPTFRG